MRDDYQTEAAVVEEVAKEAALPQRRELERGDSNKCSVLVLKDSATRTQKVVGVKTFLDEYLQAPERTKGCAVLQDLESFIAHVNRFSTQESALFANVGGPNVQCVFDYDTKDAPRFREHRARYSFPLSEEWEAWRDNADDWMGQEEFAEFIETRLLDVADPTEAGGAARSFADSLGVEFATPSRVLELSRNLNVRVDATVARVVNLSSGEGQLQYTEAHNSEYGGPVKIPGAFLLAIPVFQLGERFRIPVRLRYRLRQGTVRWLFSIHRSDVVFDTAVRETCAKAQAGTGLPLFYGQPES